MTLGRSILLSGICLLLLAAQAGADPTAPEGTPAAPAPPAAPISVTLSSPPPDANGTVPAGPVAADTLREPTGFQDIDAWVRYREEAQLTSLPMEARIFYRKAVMLRETGQRAEAMRLVQGAGRLDPGFWMPPVTMAMWQLASEPSAALGSLATAFDFAKEHFALTLTFQANLIFALIQALLLGLIAAGLITVILHNGELRHRLSEVMVPRVPRGRARAYAWLLVFVPWLIGFGVVLPTLFALAFLWTSLKLRERIVFVMLAVSFIALPVASYFFGRLASPMSENHEPFHGVLAVPDEPATPERTARLEALARQMPDNGFIQFARAWSARQTGDLAAAEAAYRRTLEIWPDDDRTLNNLGNVLDILGREEEALDAYHRAEKSNPANGAPHYNEARIHAERFDFEAATRSMNRAGELDFDLMKPYRSGHNSDDRLPTADQWIGPARLRAALSAYHGGKDLPAVPPGWRQRIESTGILFSLAVLLMVSGGIALGVVARRALAVSTCANCGITICRRCATRRREWGFCRECGMVDARSSDDDVARRALYQRQIGVIGRLRRVRTALAMFVPGFGLLAHRRMLGGLILLMLATTLAVSPWMDIAPFAYEPRVPAPDFRITPGIMPWLQFVPWLLVYAISWIGFLMDADREPRPQEPPATQRRRAQTAATTLDVEAA